MRDLVLTGVLAATLALAGAAQAKDLGARGNLFPIVETDILKILQAKLEAAKASGKMDELNREFLARSKRVIMRPDPAPGIATTRNPRSFTVDPSYVVPHDLADQTGRVFAHAGDKVNPLASLPNYRKVFVFIDGDEPRQVAFALRENRELGKERAVLILTKGSPVELMRREKLIFYFDQAGKLTTHFGVRQVPATVEREGDLMRVKEVEP